MSVSASVCENIHMQVTNNRSFPLVYLTFYFLSALEMGLLSFSYNSKKPHPSVERMGG